MKKLVFINMLFFIFLNISFASGNELIIKDGGNTLYYDAKKLNTNIYVDHKDMMPGEEYRDELIIKSESEEQYKLYFNFRMYEQAEIETELLENIILKISVDDQVMYEGNAKVILYEDKEVTLDDVIYLGEYQNGTESKMVVESKLSDSYKLRNTDVAKFDILFYIEKDDELIPINPNTNNKVNLIVLLFVLIISILIPLIGKKILSKKRFVN